jgi:hypothetical protein
MNTNKLDSPKWDCEECQYISDFMDLESEGDCCGVCGRKIHQIKLAWEKYYKDLEVEYILDRYTSLNEKIEEEHITREEKMKDLKDLTIGDTVYIGSYSSLGASSEGDEKIKDILVKYDENTGEKYNVIVCSDFMKFDARSGDGINGIMYYIESTTKI